MRKFVLSLTLLCLSTLGVLASHVMGSDITYKCISNKKFEITLKIYRDCRGIPLGNPGTFSIQCATGGTARSISYSKTSIKDITPKCRAANNPCNPQNTTVGNEGVEEHTYVGTIDFNASPLSSDVSGGCCVFRIYYDECCRNGAINTGSPGNFYADALIDICKAPCNNSPKMTNEPIAYLCCNMMFTFNNGVNDTADHDSISYQLVPAKETGGTNFSYGGGYTSTRPLTPYYPAGWSNPNNSNPNANPPIGFFLDPITGDIIFTPTGCNEVGPCVIQVNEWRKDSTGTYHKIGETRRDLQFIVKTCPGNNPPTIQGPYSYNVCEGSQLCFNINTRDMQFILPPPQTSPPPDSINITWNEGISGASFTVDTTTVISSSSSGGISTRGARFCWTPPIGKASSLPYTFTVTAKDNSCQPRPASSTRGFSVLVKPLARAQRQYTLLPCGKLKFQATPLDIYVNSYTWTIRDSTNQIINSSKANKATSNRQIDSVQFKKGGKYIFILQLNNTMNCPNFHQDTIVIPDLLEVDLALGKDTFVCAGKSITLEAKVTNGASPFRYRWTSGGTHDTLTTKTMTPGADSIATVRVSDNNGCFAYDTVKVKYIPLPIVNIGPDRRICDYDSITLDAGNPGHSFNWNTNETTQTIIIKTQGDYYVRVMDSLGCFSYDTMKLNVNDHVKSDAGPDRELCLGDTISVSAGGANNSGGKTSTYQWFFIMGSNKFINDGDTIYPYSDAATTFGLTLRTTQSGVQCWSNDSMNVEVNQLPVLTKSYLDDRCYNYGEIDLYNSGAFLPAGGVYSYPAKPHLIPDGKKIWSDSIGNKNANKTTLLTYTYTDAKGCKSSDSIPQQILRLPLVRVLDSVYCKNVAPFDLKTHVDVPKIITGVQSWKCIDDPGVVTLSGTKYMFDPAYKGAPETYTLAYEYTDGNQCTNYDTALISIIDVPVIKFNSQPGPYCMDDGTVDLSVAASIDPTGGVWTCPAKPALVESKAFLNTSVASGTYWFVYEHTATGCRVVDSIEITINPIPVVNVAPPAGKGVVCKSDADFQMVASPIGGTFSSATPGLVTSTGLFKPSAKPADNLQVGTYEVTYNYIDPLTGCDNSAKTTVKIQEPPTISASSDPMGLCEDAGSFKIKAEMNFTGIPFKWQSSNSTPNLGFGNPAGDNTTYDPQTEDKQNETVTLTVTTLDYTGNVCPTTSSSVTVEVWPRPVFSFGTLDTMGCAPLDSKFELVVTKPSSVTYRWDFGDPGSDLDNVSTLEDPEHSYKKEGWYTVRAYVTSDKGCEDSIVKKNYILVYPVPVADFDVDPQTRFTTIALPKFSFVNKSRVSTGSLRYEWDFGVDSKDDDTSTLTNPTYFYSNSPKDTGTYVVTLLITTDGGCTDIHVDSIRIGPDLTVFIPNAFSPNGYGQPDNNKFKVSAQGFATFEINIFNRWGEKLFTTKDINEGWDGNYKGRECQQDVYVYQVNITSFSGKLYKYNGTVTLLR